MFEIEKGIEIPKAKNKAMSERNVFLKSLEIGDSFKCSRKEYQCLKTYEKRLGIKLASRLVDYNEYSCKANDYYKDIVRVWRIE